MAKSSFNFQRSVGSWRVQKKKIHSPKNKLCIHVKCQFRSVLIVSGRPALTEKGEVQSTIYLNEWSNSAPASQASRSSDLHTHATDCDHNEPVQDFQGLDKLSD